MDLSRLKAPFEASDIEWRIGRAGKNAKGVWAMCLAYVTNRAIMERLDDVCGPGNWRNEYKEAPAGGVLCGLSIRVGDEWVTKWDGADNTDMEAVKGGLSGAMKRAGVQWGIGRYLYDLDEGWANVHPDGRFFGRLPKDKGGDAFHWDPPALPAWALPDGAGKPPAGHVDRKTGEVQDGPQQASQAQQNRPSSNGATAPAGDMIPCPACAGPMYDNRTDKRNPKSPDLKCKDKACDHAIWLGSWRDDLLKSIADAHTSGVIDAAQRDEAEKVANAKSPDQMLRLGKRLDALVLAGVTGS